jgi:hypothetical protein
VAGPEKRPAKATGRDTPFEQMFEQRNSRRLG